MRKIIPVEDLERDGAQDESEVPWYDCLVMGKSMDPMDASGIYGEGHPECRDCPDLLGCEAGARKIPH